MVIEKIKQTIERENLIENKDKILELNILKASKKSGERIKFKWLDEDGNETDYFFEMKIMEDEITKDVSIVVSDFAFADELEESKLLWENQISDLKHVLGSV